MPGRIKEEECGGQKKHSPQENQKKSTSGEKDVVEGLPVRGRFSVRFENKEKNLGALGGGKTGQKEKGVGSRAREEKPDSSKKLRKAMDAKKKKRDQGRPQEAKSGGGRVYAVNWRREKMIYPASRLHMIVGECFSLEKGPKNGSQKWEKEQARALPQGRMRLDYISGGEKKVKTRRGVSKGKKKIYGKFKKKATKRIS